MKYILFSGIFLAFFSTVLFATPLTNAVEKNDLIAVAHLLKQGADVNEKDPLGYTPLMIASGLGNPQMVELLLTSGADVFILDSRMGASALHKAAQSGVPDVARLLIKRGAFLDLQAPTLGHTPLIDAVWHKKAGVVKVLLEHGASIEIKTRYGATAMDIAKRDKLTEIVNLLEEHAKWKEMKIRQHRLMIAVRKNDLETVKKLIQEGVDVNEQCISDGHTPLLIASREGFTEIVRELLKAGANLRIVDGQIKATPGHKAGYRGHPEIARLLVEYGLELDAQGPYNGYTALHDAVWHGHTEAARVYLNANARLDLKGHDGRTPLQIAIEDGYPDIVTMIRAKMQEKNDVSENDVKSFVYQWFSWLDKHDEEKLLQHLSPDDLFISLGEITMRNHEDFKKWHAGMLRRIQNGVHEAENVKVTKNGDRFDVEVTVRFQAKDYEGKSLNVVAQQQWQLSVADGNRIIIHKYIAKLGNGH